MTDVESGAVVEFCGERHPVTDALTIGRDADLDVDDNPYLHRRFLQVLRHDGLWWLINVGTRLTATISDDQGAMQAWLAPGARLPLVFNRTIVWFTAGPTTYEFEVVITDPTFAHVPVEPATSGETTVGRMAFTPDQKLLIVALSEHVLRAGDRGVIPSSADAARRLGWTLTKFNRKLDNVCDKLSRAEIRGLHGGPDKLATNRRARLVEYALASRLVEKADLDLLPTA